MTCRHEGLFIDTSDDIGLLIMMSHCHITRIVEMLLRRLLLLRPRADAAADD